LEDALPPMIEREEVPYEAAFLAAKAFIAYRRRAGAAGKTSLLPYSISARMPLSAAIGCSRATRHATEPTSPRSA
jgi:hypothetical protein